MFPSKGATTCHLKPSQYDLAQLRPAIKKAVEGQVDIEEPVSSNLFHAHTFSIQASMDAPEPFEQYPDGPRENPEAKIFEECMNRVMEATEACVPLQLSPPTGHMVHMPFNIVKMKAAERSTLHVRSPDIHLPGRFVRPFVKLPAVHGDSGRAFFTSNTAWDTLSWLHAAVALDPDERPSRKINFRGEKAPVVLRAGVQVTWVPVGDGAELSLVITIDAYLDMDVILAPLPVVGDDLRRCILVGILPSDYGTLDVSQTRVDWESRKAARAAALNALYDSMVPAPDLPPGFDSGLLQPAAMHCRLLPFQKRTVALMLAREGAPITTGTVQAAEDSQWTRYHFGKFGDFAFHRLTGELKAIAETKGKARADAGDLEDRALFPRLFDTSNVQGTLLCEEMGLGKTVEAIALLLLHRHPLSVPRPLSGIIEPRKSTEVSLMERPADFDDPVIKDWLAKEHAAFANHKTWSAEAEVEVAEVAATLVVTPLPLLKQWVDEMAKHAPSLRVCVYPGWKPLIDQVSRMRRKTAKKRQLSSERKEKRRNTRIRNETRAKFAKGKDGQRVKVEIEQEEESDPEEEALDGSEESLLELTQRLWIDFVRGYDVVITTYSMLASDLAVAESAPKRSRRSTAKYGLEERPRSPLIMAEWWRVIMDEVQLHSDASAASKMVSFIPRKFSLAMSGTPAKSDINDLMGSLRFLRVPIGERTMWNRLLQDANRSALQGLIKSIAVRTLKAEVSDEFHIPPQTRFVIPVQLSDIELHYYEDTLDRQRDRFRAHGDSATFRIILRHLRQICTHIQVGALQRTAAHPGERVGRLHLGNELMTMEEALVKMSADHSTETVLLARNQLRLMIRKGQLIAMQDEFPNRLINVIALYEQVRERGRKLLEPAREQLAAVVGDREDSVDEEVDKNASQADRDHAKQVFSARATIRETLLLLHQSWFFEGDARHQLGEEEAEVAAYNNAEAIRKEILSRPKVGAERSIESMVKQIATAGEPQLDVLQTDDTDRRGGLVTANTMTEVNALLEILNDNAVLVLSWRDKLVELLKQPVEAEDDAVPGVGEGQNVENPEEEYYAQALKAQGDITAYLWAYAAAIGDRKEILLEERTLLNEHEGAVQKKRTTYRAKAAAADALPEAADDVSDLMAELHIERQAFRDRRVQEDCTRPLKALLIDLNEVVHNVARSREEVAIAKDASLMLRKFITAQTDMIAKLNKELDLFRATYNKRVKYFAALQEISDSVSAPMFKNLAQDIASTSEEILAMETSLGRMAVRGRYLKFLGSSDEREREDCTICFGTSEDKFAVLLDCGHAFCVSCFAEYRKSAYIGSRCATCKAPIPDRKLTRIRIKPEEGAAEGTSATVEEIEEEPEEELSADQSEEAERQSRLADLRKLQYLPETQQRAIKDIDMMGDYGSKINTLIKHLKLYRIQHPEVRHVVFSNWADSLYIVERALKLNHIRYVSFEANSKNNDVVSKFHADESISVFLLHSERESAGLTLTSCTAVHLLEPVLQHSFELQAIGRVDRLGQTRNTSVYCYSTMDTVESRILSQGVRNGTSIYLQDREADQEAMRRMPHVVHAAGSGGDISTVSAADEDLLKLIF